jgi:hypothetical protein
MTRDLDLVGYSLLTGPGTKEVLKRIYLQGKGFSQIKQKE